MKDSSSPKRGDHLKLTHLHGGEVIHQPMRSLAPRVLSDFEMVYIIEGSADYIADGEQHVVPPGGFILGRPGTQEIYNWDRTQKTRHAYFHFGIQQVPADWSQPTHWPRVRTRLPPFCSSLFQHIVHHIYENIHDPLLQPSLRECRLLEALMDTFLEDHHRETAAFERIRPEPVRRALVYLRTLVEENPTYPLTLAEIAQQATVTDKHLCRLFSKWVGFSPMQTYTLLKLQSAQVLLGRTNLAIKEVAERCGFENPLYFSRCFAKTFEMSPSAFRLRLKNGSPPPVTNTLPIDLIACGKW